MKMKSLPLVMVCAVLGGVPVRADLLIHEPFDYLTGDLTGGDGGSGWSSAWADSGNPVVTAGSGLTYTDSIGNTLAESASSVNTSDGGGATTISSRETGARDGEAWISMLIQPQSTATNFVGVSFYNSDLTLANARFAIEHADGKNLRLTRRAGGQVNSPSFTTTVGTTVFAVIHLVPAGGDGESFPDRLDVYFNPELDFEPGVPHASINIDGLFYDRVRVAAANGRAARVDELRIGDTYADVAPYVPAVDPDHDGDGLTDSQEETLGLDPFFPDTGFIAALKANPGFVGLRSENEIVDVRVGAAKLVPFDENSFDYEFSIFTKDGEVIETNFIPVNKTADPRFLRLHLDTP